MHRKSSQNFYPLAAGMLAFFVTLGLIITTAVFLRPNVKVESSNSSSPFYTVLKSELEGNSNLDGQNNQVALERNYTEQVPDGQGGTRLRHIFIKRISLYRGNEEDTLLNRMKGVLLNFRAAVMRFNVEPKAKGQTLGVNQTQPLSTGSTVEAVKNNSTEQTAELNTIKTNEGSGKLNVTKFGSQNTTVIVTQMNNSSRVV